MLGWATKQPPNGKDSFAPIMLNTETQTRLPRSEIMHLERWKSFRGSVFVQECVFSQGCVCVYVCVKERGYVWVPGWMGLR